MDKQKLIEALKQFQNKSILVIGDLMLDKYIWGEVSRISPEAPVQIVNVKKETFEPGGAANVANNVSALTGKSYIIGITGKDNAREVLIKELNEKNINTEGIIIDDDKPTIQKVRVLGQSQQLLRFDYENKEHIHKTIEEKIIKFVDSIIEKIDVIVISDYAKGVVTKNLMLELNELSIKYNKPIIVDPKPKHIDLYSNVTLITPNLKEAKELSGIEEDVLEIGNKLQSQLNSNILITRGEKGMMIFHKDGKVDEIPGNKREVYSLIGAGDTVVATTALALASELTLKEAAFLGNLAAGIKVGKVGTATVSIEEIKKELEENN